MPLQNKPLRVCIVGDSQIGSVREAHDTGLIAWPEGSHVEFWGAPGPQFRGIQWNKGAVRVKDDVRDTVLRINGQGRDHLSAEDFDIFLFYGARLRVVEYLAPMLQWRDKVRAFASSAVLHEAASSFLICTRAFRIASDLARSGGRVWYFPAAFPTAGVVSHKGVGGLLEAYPEAESATQERRAHLWASLQQVSASEGVTLMPQPEQTVSQGVLTDYSWACRDAIEKRDFGHKSAQFAALWINQALAQHHPEKLAA